jgi:hypothetical protein
MDKAIYLYWQRIVRSVALKAELEQRYLVKAPNKIKLKMRGPSKSHILKTVQNAPGRSQFTKD